jgi:hypothetical protein
MSRQIGATNPSTNTGKGARVTQRATSLRWRLAAAAVLAAVLVASSPADAYIGPGAGFAVLGSFAVLFATTLIAGFASTIDHHALFRAIRCLQGEANQVAAASHVKQRQCPIDDECRSRHFLVRDRKIEE